MARLPIFALLLSVVLAAAAPPAARAADEATLAETAHLSSRLAALDADPAFAGRAGLERFKARAALDAVASARSRDRAHALWLARTRVAAAEHAAQAEALMQQSAQLDRERDQIELEASRRQALAAQREADRLRRQALAREEEAQRLAEAIAVERAELEESSATSDAAAEQALKLAEARAEETRLARKEAELASALAADAGNGSAAGSTRAPPPPARSSGKGTVYTLPGTAFASGSATLAPSAIASLRSLFSAIGAKKTLRVEAHTDSQGPDAANLALSQKRAEAVKRALVQAGIGAARIRAVGKGEANPVADNASADGRARNRRVEIVVE
jgi:outer membrane protein OmpA-like peptidoglycan-associated protein